MRATRAIIHLDNLSQNISRIKKAVHEKVTVCIPVKADAYGHGAIPVAKTALEAGADCLAVATADEGIELRKAGIDCIILVLGIGLPEEIPLIVGYGLTPMITDREVVAALQLESALQGRRTSCHLKVDTGMGRIGCLPEEAADLAAEICRNRNLVLSGTATHLSVSDSPLQDDEHYTTTQLARFTQALEHIRAAGIDPGLVHASNSGAIISRPDAHFDMIRPGILVYGYQPSADCPTRIPVTPVMELETRLVSVRSLRAGSAVSYGRTWVAGQDTVIGTLPIGYADGLHRNLSPGLKVEICGDTYPVVGRICMDQCMVDLGPHSRIKRWEKVTIFGPGLVSASDVARVAGTIPYEITCAINNRRVPRVYTGTPAYTAEKR